jgi:hypothetical protein
MLLAHLRLRGPRRTAHRIALMPQLPSDASGNSEVKHVDSALEEIKEAEDA